MIITISREFGSGGREFGKHLSEALQIPCYDHTIIELISKENGRNNDYVARVSESDLQVAYPPTIGRRFSIPYKVMEQSIRPDSYRAQPACRSESGCHRPCNNP